MKHLDLTKKEFIIDRTKWRSGDDHKLYKLGKGETKLLNEEGFSCCLGQIAQQIGYTDTEIFQCAEPDQIKELADSFLVYIREYDGEIDVFTSNLSCDLMAINDSHEPQAEREEAIIKRAAKDGITIRFIN